ncbi:MULTISPECIES: hypothetical protein [unclassified Variovorax]|uniref:hypothetical protein n=1 Tax=unclassified Variovorax TaxID=663243 RepID=UPI003ED0D364
MCMEIWLRIANAQLPFTTASPSQIDKVRLLEAAGYVKAFIPPVHIDPDDCTRQDPTKVFEVTARGRQALNQGSIAHDLPFERGEFHHAAS